MTGLLQETMRERADRADGPKVDLDAVMAAGARRRRRRGALVIAGAAAVCAIVGIGGVQVIGTSDSAQGPGYAGPDTSGNATRGAFRDRKVSYAVGSTIHYGDTTIDAGRNVETLVQTDDGFVFTDSEDGAYFADGSSVRLIEHGVGKLRADESGSYVAWVNEGAGSHEYVVFDTASAEEVQRVSASHERAAVVAVDGSKVYVTDGQQLKRIDVANGNVERLRGGIADPYQIGDVENGLILRQLDDGYDFDRKIPLGTVINRDPTADGPRTVEFAHSLSPGARYVAGGPGTERLYNTETAKEIELHAGSYDTVLVSRWLDADTVAVLGLDEDTKSDGDLEISLLRCEVPSGECDVVEEGLPGDVSVPIGEDLFGK